MTDRHRQHHYLDMEVCMPPSVWSAYLRRRPAPGCCTAPRPPGCPRRHWSHQTRSRTGSCSVYHVHTPHSDRTGNITKKERGRCVTKIKETGNTSKLNFDFLYDSPKSCSHSFLWIAATEIGPLRYSLAFTHCCSTAWVYIVVSVLALSFVRLMLHTLTGQGVAQKKKGNPESPIKGKLSCLKRFWTLFYYFILQ